MGIRKQSREVYICIVVCLQVCTTIPSVLWLVPQRTVLFEVEILILQKVSQLSLAVLKENTYQYISLRQEMVPYQEWLLTHLLLKMRIQFPYFFYIFCTLYSRTYRAVMFSITTRCTNSIAVLLCNIAFT